MKKNNTFFSLKNSLSENLTLEPFCFIQSQSFLCCIISLKNKNKSPYQTSFINKPIHLDYILHLFLKFSQGLQDLSFKCSCWASTQITLQGYFHGLGLNFTSSQQQDTKGMLQTSTAAKNECSKTTPLICSFLLFTEIIQKHIKIAARIWVW